MILNIYKPKGWTSFDVVAKVRNYLRQKSNRKVRVGHAGTLDPLAEGVLLVLTDEDTKKQNDLMFLRKTYEAKIAFGAISETYDLEGALELSSGYEKIDIETLRSKLDKLLSNYIGKINQKVPPYSAIKRDGKKLYQQARFGKEPLDSLPSREIEIYDFKIKQFQLEEVKQNNVSFQLPVLTCEITCSKGTYIRSIAYDIGQDLTVGGVLVKLVRTKIGSYSVEDSITLQKLISES